MWLASPPPWCLVMVSWILAGLLVVALACRFWGRARDHIRFGYDDWLAIASAVCFLLVWPIAVTAGALDGNLGNHAKTDTNGNPLAPNQTFRNSLFVYLTFQVFPIGLARCAILLYYLRLFFTKPFKVIVWTIIGFNVAWMTAYFIANLVETLPTRSTGAGKRACNTLIPINVTLAMIGAAYDLVILLLPVPFLWTVHMAARQKISVGSILLLGNAIFAFSIVRLYAQIAAGMKCHNAPTEITYIAGAGVIWALLEAGLATLTAILLTLSPVLKYSLPPMHNSSSTTITRRGSSTSSSLSVGLPGSRSKTHWCLPGKGPSLTPQMSQAQQDHYTRRQPMAPLRLSTAPRRTTTIWSDLSPTRTLSVIMEEGTDVGSEGRRSRLSGLLV